MRTENRLIAFGFDDFQRGQNLPFFYRTSRRNDSYFVAFFKGFWEYDRHKCLLLSIFLLYFFSFDAFFF